MAPLSNPFQGKTVLITGHTGFKGSWLSEWLLMLGARVVGIGLPPDTSPALFDQLGLSERMEHHILDIREPKLLKTLVIDTQPDFVFHLAAQSLVRRSFLDPVDTWDINVRGTVNLLEALRELEIECGKSGKSCASLFITTDKCYENREWLYGYREEDPLGGHDPYSASKAAAELAIASYRKSFFMTATRDNAPRISVASARAGNVIGGGDWSADRIIPDCVRHLQVGQVIPVRNPNATRPWQHVLEPLSGYLQLAAQQESGLRERDLARIDGLSQAFNFGPVTSSNQPVSVVVDEIIRHWPGTWNDRSDPAGVHEAGRLGLSWDLAYHRLGWHPRWNFAETVERTVNWYKAQLGGSAKAQDLVRSDIEAYGDIFS